MKKIFILMITGFILGYLFASWTILAGKGLSPYSFKDIGKENLQERRLTIFHAINPFEPMNPGFYYLFFASH